MFPKMFLFVLVCLMPSLASAQLFPNARWNKGSQPNVASSSCPGGVCPTGMTTSDTTPGHWTYPGLIGNHLERDHGVATSGMSRQEQLNLHDSLHEGVVRSVPGGVPKVVYQPTYQAVSNVTSYGSTGSSVVSYGSTGSAVTRSGGSTGSTVVTTTRTTAACNCNSANCNCGEVLSTSAVNPLALRNRDGFRKALIDAARESRKSGEISALEFFSIVALSRIPSKLDQMQAAVHDYAIEEGLATTQAIDWEQLLSFLEKLIPLLLQLFG